MQTSVLVVVCPDPKHDLAQQSHNFAAHILQCNPSTDIVVMEVDSEVSAMLHKDMFEKISEEAQHAAGNLQYFYLAKLTQGPLKGLKAICAGSNKVTLQRSSRLALLAEASVGECGDATMKAIKQCCLSDASLREFMLNARMARELVTKALTWDGR